MGFQIVVPILTPYLPDGTVDYRALSAHASALADRGVDGIFVAGTNGEGPLLADDEVVAMTRAVRAAARGLTVIPQAGRPGTDATRVLLERLVAEGIDAAAVVTPYFFTLGREEALEHYGRLIEAAGDLPLYAYVVPAYARNDLPPDWVRALAAEGLAGIKDSTKSIERHREYVAIAESAPRSFATYVGTDALMLQALELGATGAVPVLANAWPDLVVDFARAAGAGDGRRAAELQEEIAQTRESLRDGGIAALKRAVRELLVGDKIDYRHAVRGPLLARDTAHGKVEA